MGLILTPENVMSLEEALKANTAALERHTAMIEKMLSGAKAAAPAAKPEPAKAEAPKPAAGKATTTKRKGEITVEAFAEKLKTFLKTGDEDARVERRSFMSRLIAHYGVDKMTALDPTKFEEALDMIAKFENGDDPTAEEAGDEDGDGDDAMV